MLATLIGKAVDGAVFLGDFAIKIAEKASEQILCFSRYINIGCNHILCLYLSTSNVACLLPYYIII